MLHELELRVLEVYRDLDLAVSGFASRTGLSCPEGCGECCLSQKVEATVLECIPLAFELFRTLQGEFILKRLEKYDDNRQCVLFRPDYLEASLWGCTQYRFRTVVCRLFGFAGNRDRQGIARLAMCRVMKSAECSRGTHIYLDDEQAPMPQFAEAGLRMTALHPGLGTVRLPINIALREALQKVGVFLELSGMLPTGKSSVGEQPPHEPDYPHQPAGRRAA